MEEEFPVQPDDVRIRGVDNWYGWLGNMSSYKIDYQGVTYRTAEHLFQCLRFNNPAIQAEIQSKGSPMQAKWRAKSRRTEMSITPMSTEDLQNMKDCLNLKLDQNRNLIKRLLKLGNRRIVEDASNRRQTESSKFWGVRKENGVWLGKNMLGKLWMEIREERRH